MRNPPLRAIFAGPLTLTMVLRLYSALLLLLLPLLLLLFSLAYWFLVSLLVFFSFAELDSPKNSILFGRFRLFQTFKLSVILFALGLVTALRSGC
jgi:hypothetical protein